MKLVRITALALLTSLAACASKQIMTAENSKTTSNKLIEMNADWVKVKGSNFDVEIEVRNISKNDIIFMLNDMDCMRGEAHGVLKHTFFNTGERVIDFRAGQSKKFRMVCKVTGKATGDAKVIISKIFDNPTHDGATRGAVLGGPVGWQGTLK